MMIITTMPELAMYASAGVSMMLREDNDKIEIWSLFNLDDYKWSELEQFIEQERIMLGPNIELHRSN